MKVQQFRQEATSALSLPPSPSVPALLEDLVKKEKSLDISVPEKDKLKKVCRSRKIIYNSIIMGFPFYKRICMLKTKHNVCYLNNSTKILN